MNNLRQLCAALVLTLTLSATALAGQVNCPGITQPPPDGLTSETQSSDVETNSTITEALLILIEGVLLVP
jgi:hypothetical protein